MDEYRVVKTLLENVLSKGIKPDYVSQLLAIIEHEIFQRKTAQDGQLLLSTRELEVLRFMALDLPNKQIASKLFISTGTVKLHVHSILDKFNVRARSQAVSRAREIRLI